MAPIQTPLPIAAERFPDALIDEAAERLSPSAARAFRTACKAVGAVTLAQLRDKFGAFQQLIRALPKGESSSIFLVLDLWLRDLAERPAHPSRGPEIPAGRERSTPPLRESPSVPPPPPPPPPPDPELPPTTREGVTAWAKARGIERMLGFPLIVLHQRAMGLPRSYDDRGVALEAVFSPFERSPLTSGLTLVQLERLREVARVYLLEMARERAALEARRGGFLANAIEKLSPMQQAFDERLVALEALAQDQGATLLDLHVGYPLGAVRFFDSGPARLELLPDGRPEGSLLSLPLVDFVNGLYDPLLESRNGQTFARVLFTSARLARDFLRDPEAPAASKLRAWLDVPPWQRTLARIAALEARSPTASVNESRLAFRVSVHKSVVHRVEAYIQTPRKGGGFTVGHKVTAQLALPSAATALELRILETLAEVEARSWYVSLAPDARRVSALLGLLADHPRVSFADDARTPVRIRRARLTLAVVPCAGGYELAISVGGARTTAEALYASRLGDGTVLVVDDIEGEIALSKLTGAGQWLVAALAEFPAVFPAEATDQLLALLERAQDGADVEVPDELVGRTLPADLSPVVRLELLPGAALLLAVHVRPLLGGPLLEPGSGTSRVFGVDAGGRVSTHRSLEEERATAERLLAELPLGDATRDEAWVFRVDEPDRAADVIVALAAREGVVVEWPAGRAPTVLHAARRTVRLRIERKRDWFGVDGEIDVDGTKVALATLLTAARSGHRFVRVGTDTIIALADELRQSLRDVDDAVVVDAKGEVRAGNLAITALDALVDDHAQIDAAKEWLEVREKLAAAATYEPKLPKKLEASLRPYQLEGFRWLARLAEWAEGAVLADDMGLGKTVQAITLLLHRQTKGPALIVAPTTVGPNWLAEIARFAPSLRTHSYRGTDRGALLDKLRPGDVLVTSYDIVSRDAERLAGIAFGTLVLDEAQAIKNAASRRAGAVRGLVAGFRVALSGTPIENHLGELWSLFRAVSPDLFGTWERFRERFAGPIERDRDPVRRAALASLLRPYLLRRTKTLVAPELPARTETVRSVELSPPERERYETERLAALAAMEAADPTTGRFEVLAALTRLRRAACNIKLIDETSVLASAKLGAFLELVEQLREGGHRALVFSQFTSHLALVREALDARRVRYLYLDGQTSSDERTRLVGAFQAGEGELFLLSLKAGGTGINLTAADYVVHLDPWWNPAAEDQATDRAHRIGQSKPVTVVRLVSEGTIEEAVLALHAEKRELAESLLAGGDLAAKLSAADLVALVRAGESSSRAD